MLLKALLASTSNTPSTLSSLYSRCIACTAASCPAGRPEHAAVPTGLAACRVAGEVAFVDVRLDLDDAAARAPSPEHLVQQLGGDFASVSVVEGGGQGGAGRRRAEDPVDMGVDPAERKPLAQVAA